MSEPKKISEPPKATEPVGQTSNTSLADPLNGASLDLWAQEAHPEGFALAFQVRQTLFSGKSEFQRVDVIETVPYGRMLLNDGLVMATERDEHIYHEMLAHVPLFTHPHPRKVLVIGGGDGGTVREVLRHPSVEICYLVEIDELVVNACKEYLPQTAACLADARVRVEITDGVKFIAQTQERFDVILVDSTDPIGPATPLFGDDFYSNIERCLTADGIVVAQGESAFFNSAMQEKLLQILQPKFARRYLYNYSNLTYPGGLWSFVMGSRRLCPLADFSAQRWAACHWQTQYYNAQIHRASFALPQEMYNKFSRYLTELSI